MDHDDHGETRAVSQAPTPILFPAYTVNDTRRFARYESDTSDSVDGYAKGVFFAARVERADAMARNTNRGEAIMTRSILVLGLAGVCLFACDSPATSPGRRPHAPGHG